MNAHPRTPGYDQRGFAQNLARHSCDKPISWAQSAGKQPAVKMTLRLILLLLPLLSRAQSPPAGSAAPVPGADFFTNGSPHTFAIQLTDENLNVLRTSPREYVRATVRANGRTYTNVGVHLKGVATFRPIDDQPSLTLNFSKFVSEQRFHGLRKIHLNNGKEDPTFLCEALSAEIFAQAGLPAARVTHARTRLNGRELGPYVVIEGFTPEFLARYFQDTRGNLYDSGFRHDVTYPLERLSGKRPDNWKDLKQLSAAAEIRDLQERWSQLALCLDTNGFARYLAMQALIANWDGYAFYKNNYRIYHDPDSDRLHFIAHGMDQTFAKATFPLMPPRWDGLVARAFMETREGRALYQHQLGLLFTNYYHTEALVSRVDELARPLRPLFAEQGPAAAVAHDRLVAALRRRIEQRGVFLAEQLATTNWMQPPPVNLIQRRPVPVSPPRQ
jgi:spore coat protein H